MPQPAATVTRDTSSSIGLLALVTLANVAATMTFGVLGVLTPVLTRQLGVALSEGIWIPDAYLVAVVCMTPLCAYLARRYDPRWLLAVALCGLSVPAAMMSLATSLPMLLVIVFIHGLFAALVAPITQQLVVNRLPTAQRGRGMAWWTAGVLAGGLLGGTLGGPLQTHLGLVWATLLVLPVAVAALLVLWSQGRRWARWVPPVIAADVRGAMLLIGCTLSLGLLLNLGGNVNWFAHPSTVVYLLLFIGSLVGFAVHYRQHAEPIIDLGTLVERRFAAAAAMVLIVNLVSTGQFETEILGTVLAFDADFLGLRAALGGVGLLFGVAVAGALAQRLPPIRALVVATVVLLAGKAGYLLYTGAVGPVLGLWPAVLSSVGYGMIATLLAALAFDGLAPVRVAAATAVFVFAGQLGAALGLAALDVLMERFQSTADGREGFMLVFIVECLGTVALLALLPACGAPRAKTTLSTA